MLTFPISVVRLSSYHKTVLIDGYTKFLNIKSYYFYQNYSSLYLRGIFLHKPEIKLVIPILLFALGFVRGNLNYSCI